jgi:hypothetical protein
MLTAGIITLVVMLALVPLALLRDLFRVNRRWRLVAALGGDLAFGAGVQARQPDLLLIASAAMDRAAASIGAERDLLSTGVAAGVAHALYGLCRICFGFNMRRPGER